MLFSAAWTAAQAKDVLTRVSSDFVVVADASGYYIFTREEAIPLVLDPAGSTASEIFGLADLEPTPT